MDPGRGGADLRRVNICPENKHLLGKDIQEKGSGGRGKPMISISVCMIVKNEEEILKRCLDSLQGIWEELVIVDTGSSDRTMEIARSYTDLVYEYPWTGDFSEARNFAFSKCTKDYIYSADADEVLDKENRKQFLILKQVLDERIEIVQMRYGNQLENGTIYNFDEEYRPKLFKRLRSFQWIYPIHETVRLDPLVFESDVVITHRPKDVSSHTARDLAAFERVTKKEGRLDKRLHSLYAKELFVSGKEEDFLRAERYFQTAAEDPEADGEGKLESSCVVARAARLRGDMEMFYRYALKGVAIGGCSELCYELGEYYLAKGLTEEARRWYKTALQDTECMMSIRYGKDLPEEALSRIGYEK